MMQQPYNLVWLRGVDCDGCTIAALGDTSAGGFERLLSGEQSDLPPIELIHPLLALEAGDAFIDKVRRCAAGELGPFGVVVESAIPGELHNAGYLASLGEENGQPVSIATWLARLAPGSDFVIAVGDCAVWGGPHSIGENPSASTGVGMRLGEAFRSRLGLPVINVPGCAPPRGLLALIAEAVGCACGLRSVPDLDVHSRPRLLYGDVWKGALALWQP